MCKFNNRLFVFSLLCLLGMEVLAKPALKQDQNPEPNLDFNELMALTALLTPQDNYDLHYDQRQKGDENYRVKLDGFFIGFPQEESSSLLLLTDDLLENFDEDLFLNSGKNRQQPSMAGGHYPERAANLNLENYQKQMQSMPPPQQNSPTPVLVEIPAPNKQGEPRHYGDDTEEFPNRPSPRTKSYMSHLLGLLKRGRRY